MGDINSQTSQLFAINPLQYAAVKLYPDSAIAQPFNKFYEQFEGTGFTIVQTDYPAIITIVDKQSGLETSYVARNGLHVKAAFRGFTVHMPQVSAGLPVLRMVIEKDCVTYENQYAFPMLGCNTSFINTGNAAALQTLQIYVPPEAVRLEKIAILQPGTTVASALLNFNGGNLGTTQLSNIQLVDEKGGVIYNAPNLRTTYLDITQPSPGQFVCRGGPYQLSTECTALQVSIVGTVMTNVNAAVECIFS